MNLSIQLAIGIVVSILIVVIVGKYSERKQKQLLDLAFKGRESLTTEQFYQRFFENQGIPFDVVEGVKNIFSEELAIDFSRLHDDDDFSKNIRFIWDLDSMADVEIVLALEKKFSIRIDDDEAANIRTFRDLVHFVNDKTKRSE
ncbi:MAG: acyl carrier protein [Methyloglobulus sp.]|nr:acyl carrier protein [Methyloglobulus sp.]